MVIGTVSIEVEVIAHIIIGVKVWDLIRGSIVLFKGASEVVYGQSVMGCIIIVV